MWLTQKIEYSHSLDMSGIVLSNCLYGLRSMRSDHREVQYLLEVLGGHALRQQKQQQKQLLQLQLQQQHKASVQEESGGCEPPEWRVRGQLLLGAQGLTNSLYGLKGMSSECRAVRDMLSILTSRIPHPSGSESSVAKEKGGVVQLRAQHLATALYGLQRLSSSHEEVTALLAALVPYIESSVGGLSPKHAGMALRGFTAMRSDDSVWVTKAMQALAAVLQRGQESGGVVDVQAVVMCMSGLRGMNSSSPQVRAVVRALIPLVENCSSNWEVTGLQFRAVSVAAVLGGLGGGLSLRHREVRHLVSALLPLVRRCEEAFWPDSMAVALSGLACASRRYSVSPHPAGEAPSGDGGGVEAEGMEEDMEALSRELLNVLLVKLRAFGAASGGRQQFTPSQVCLAVGGLRHLGERGALDGVVWGEVEEVLRLLADGTPPADSSPGRVDRSKQSGGDDEVEGISSKVAGWRRLVDGSADLAGALSGLHRMCLQSDGVKRVLLVLHRHAQAILVRHNSAGEDREEAGVVKENLRLALKSLAGMYLAGKEDIETTQRQAVAKKSMNDSGDASSSYMNARTDEHYNDGEFESGLQVVSCLLHEIEKFVNKS
jgi:hypothetical protein